MPTQAEAQYWVEGDPPATSQFTDLKQERLRSWIICLPDGICGVGTVNCALTPV